MNYAVDRKYTDHTVLRLYIGPYHCQMMYVLYNIDLEHTCVHCCILAMYVHTYVCMCISYIPRYVMILIGNQHAMERKEKSEKRQLRGSHPGCLAEAAIITEPDN